MILRGIFLRSVLVSLTVPAHGQADELHKRLGPGKKSALSDATIASGLKEALQVGATNAVSLTGKRGGYFSNQAIKILMPKNMPTVEKGPQSMGFGPEMDEFILSINRSAETAAPAAKQIFIDAILSMSFDDARKILSGNDTTATDYFQG